MSAEILPFPCYSASKRKLLLKLRLINLEYQLETWQNNLLWNHGSEILVRAMYEEIDDVGAELDRVG